MLRHHYQQVFLLLRERLDRVPHPTTCFTNPSISFISAVRCFFILRRSLPSRVAVSSFCGGLSSKYFAAFVCADSLSSVSFNCTWFVRKVLNVYGNINTIFPFIHNYRNTIFINIFRCNIKLVYLFIAFFRKVNFPG